MIKESIVCCYLYLISKYGYPPPAENTAGHLEELKRLGFTSVELEGIRSNHLMGVYRHRQEIADKVTDLGLKVPYFCVVLPGLSAEESEEREKNLHLFEKGCEIAALLNARGVLDNAPLPPYHFPKDIPVVRHYDENILRIAMLSKNLQWNKYWDGLINTFQTACEIAARKNLTYLMHPCLGVMAASSESYLHFFDAVGKNNLKFNLDTANQFYMKENLSLALYQLIDHIDYIHVSDNSGDKVEHLMPGQGKIDWEGFFETLENVGFKGYLGLDIGGEESGVQDLGDIYLSAARWVEKKWNI